MALMAIGVPGRLRNHGPGRVLHNILKSKGILSEDRAAFRNSMERRTRSDSDES